MKTSLFVHMSFPQMTYVVYLSFHSLPFLRRSFLLSQGQTLNTCSGMTDSVWRRIREEAKEGNHISSSAIYTDSLSRLVLMKSHLSLACLDSISLSLIVLTLSLALSGPWWPCVCVRLRVCLSVCLRVAQRLPFNSFVSLYYYTTIITLLFLVLLAVSQIFFLCNPLKNKKKLFSKLLKRV